MAFSRCSRAALSFSLSSVFWTLRNGTSGGSYPNQTLSGALLLTGISAERREYAIACARARFNTAWTLFGAFLTASCRFFVRRSIGTFSTSTEAYSPRADVASTASATRAGAKRNTDIVTPRVGRANRSYPALAERVNLGAYPMPIGRGGVFDERHPRSRRL